MERKHIVWNVENINRLQDWYATSTQNESNYFGYQVGEAIVYFCNYFIKDIHRCRVLDYGCGLGHIMKCFTEKKVHVWGVDMSQEAAKACRNRCKGSKYFHGVKVFNGQRLPYEDDYFDFITCTECVEHILPEHMDNLLLELIRVLKPGGRILITTRNEEKLEESELLCPECNTLFHRVGHVNWYSVESLTHLMEAHGFKTVMCHGTDFWQFQKYLKHPPILDMSIRQIYRQIKRFIFRLTDTHEGTLQSSIFKKNMNLNREPNLFYVGEK